MQLNKGFDFIVFFRRRNRRIYAYIHKLSCICKICQDLQYAKIMLCTQIKLKQNREVLKESFKQVGVLKSEVLKNSIQNQDIGNWIFFQI